MSTMEEQVKTAFREFFNVQAKFGKFGAADTEPRVAMYEYLEWSLRLREREVPLPTTARQWQLYTSSMNCSNAARALTAALKKLETKLLQLDREPGGRAVIKEYVRSW